MTKIICNTDSYKYNIKQINLSVSLLHFPVVYIIHNISYIRDKVRDDLTRIVFWYC